MACALPAPLARRRFLAGAGAAFLTGLAGPARAALEGDDTLFAAAAMRPDGRFAAVLFNPKLEVVRTVPLPARGHDVTLDRRAGLGVAFARRPGVFAVAFDLDDRRRPVTITAAEGRHFYGHGFFSPDGRLLYASENDFAAARGVVGIYDATDGFGRIGEFETAGTGPHEILAMPDGRTIAVANGGIETHPDYGRRKLNLATMAPSIAFLDRRNGDVLEVQRLPAGLNQLSIRHMDVDGAGRIFFGCQYQGAATDLPDLVGWTVRGEAPRLFAMPEHQRAALRNYIGSVAVSGDGERLAVTSPHGELAAILSARDGTVLQSRRGRGVCGVAPSGPRFVTSSDRGVLASHARQVRLDLAFDNHIAALVG